MKKTLFTLIAAFIALPLFSQEIIHRDSIMQDASQSLLKSKVIELDSIGQQEIKQRVKNWAGKTFVNMNEVLVSETDNQLVFRYIENYNVKVKKMIVPSGEYTRLIIQIKDGKLKASFYDEGNKHDLSIKVTDCFKVQNVDFIKNEGNHMPTYSALTSYMSSYLSTLSSIETSLKKQDKIVLQDF